jgi:protein arginine kinase
MENNSASDSFLSLRKPWFNSTNPIWLASTVSLKRNIEKFKFPNKLDVER